MNLHRLTAIFTRRVKKRPLFAISLLFYLLLSISPQRLRAQEKPPHSHIPHHEQNDTGYSYFRCDTVPRLVPLVVKALPAAATNGRTAVTTTSTSTTTATTTSAVARVAAGSMVPTLFEPDRSKSVGEIPITSSMSASGAVNYSVPVQVAPGRNGAQPQLSIQYSSQSGNGVMGMGWAVGGLSAIRISNASIYYDGKTEGYNLDKNDPFTLDGMRLIKLSDNGYQIDYEAEQGNIRVSAYLNGNAIKYFRVYYTNGTSGVFGFDYNNQQQFTYPITKYEDGYGNSVVYNYTYRNEHYYITGITYGSGTSVDFNYGTRNDLTTVYALGRTITEDYLLQSITCKYDNGTVLRNYGFDYETGSNVSLLKKIHCTAAGGELNPLIFYYGDGTTYANLDRQSTQLYSWFSNTSVSNLRISRGKFDYGTNNDGLIVYPNLNPYLERYESGNIFNHSKKWYQNNFNPNQQLLIYQGLQDSWASPTVNLTAETGFVNMFSADIDGKPGEEIIKINNYQGGNGTDEVTFKIYKPNLYAGIAFDHSVGADFGGMLDWYGTKSVHPKYFYAGDFNGDGRSEMLVVSCNRPLGRDEIPSTTYIIDMVTGARLFEGSGQLSFNIDFSNLSGQYDDKLIVMDYNGDGKDDICHITDNGTNFYTFDVSGSSYSLRQISANGNLTKSTIRYREWFIAELNGDGKPDFIIAPNWSSTYTWTTDVPVYAPRYCPNCGAEGSYEGGYCNVCWNFLYEQDYCYECGSYLSYNYDYNTGQYVKMCPNHGTTITVTHSQYNDNGNSWTAYHSKGDGYFDVRSIPIKNYESGEKFVFQDMNSDGLSDLVSNYNGGLGVYLNTGGSFDNYSSAYNWAYSDSYLVPVSIGGYTYNSQLLNLYNDQVYKLSFTRNDGHQRLLTGAINSQGVIAKNSYAYLNEGVYLYGNGNSYYSPGYGATFPYENYQGPYTVVTNAQTWQNNVKQTDLSYSYTNAMLHRQGLGFLGFETVQIYDEKKGLYLTRTMNPLQYGVVTKEQSAASVTDFLYNITTDYNKIARVRLVQKTATDQLKNITVTTTCTHDTYGNPITEVVDYGGGLKTTTNTGYFNQVTPSKNVIGLVLSQTITKERSGWMTIVGTSTTYNAQQQPLSRTSDVNGNTAKQETWAYDGYGNITEEKTKVFNAPIWMVNLHEYDGSGRFRTKTTNPLSQATIFTYNGDGTLKTQTDFKGNVTSYEYDSWQRKTKATNPDGTIQTTTYEWQPAGSSRLYAIKQETTGKPTSKVHYDAFNRNVRNTITGFDGTEVHTDQNYDDFGRVRSVSQPFNYSTTGSTTNSYDQYDRLTQVTTATGNNITYSYSDNSVTETKNGVSETKTFDALGSLIRVDNPSGSISYTIRPDGQFDHIAGPSGQISFNFDAADRKVGTQDPAAGLTQYGYDNAGNLIIQTDANNKAIWFWYDNYNRITDKITPEFSTSYSYNADGRLQSTTSTNGTSKTFWYDNLGRVTQTREETAAEYLQVNYTYQNGQLQQATYLPMNYTVNYLYNAYGYLYRLTDAAGQTIRNINKVNVFGKEEESLLGNGLLETQSFDANGFLTNMKTAYGQTVIRNLETSFDNITGNLLYRKDLKRGLTENFEYDQFDRLTTFGIASNVQHITYNNSSGNITNKSDVGNYNYYLSTNPYAVSSVVGSNVQPSNPQTITYTSFARPLQIKSDPGDNSGYKVMFTYNDSYERAIMETRSNDFTMYFRYYFAGGKYEKTVDANTGETRTLLYIDGSPYDASVVLENNNGSTRLLYISRDHLGSITHITDANRNLVAEYNYDAWGKPRNPDTWAPANASGYLLDRGYTSHEYLYAFQLINMNARLYDPWLGKMLSPDNYVQDLSNTQNFNRYSYALNNPLKYKDPSGDLFIIDDFVIGFIKGAVLSAFGQHEAGSNRTLLGDAWGSAVRHTVNSIRIWGGLFTTNPTRGNFLSRTWELVSRFTWQLPQTVIGFSGAHAMNTFGTVTDVDYFDGATVLQGAHETLWWGLSQSPAVTIGSFIMGGSNIRADENNTLFAHEYGHYLQSQAAGPAFLYKYGIPSMTSQDTQIHPHNNHAVEQDADARAFMYFSERYAGTFNQGTFLTDNPIRGYAPGSAITDPVNQAALRDALMGVKWYDYMPGFAGFMQAAYYGYMLNRHQP